MKRVLFVLGMAVVLVLTACGGNNNGGAPAPAAVATVPAEYAGKTNPLGPEAAAAGADVFRTNCESCHGRAGHGDGPASTALDPKPKNLAELQTTAEDDYLFWRVAEGKPGTAMIAWKGILSEEQIWQTVAFIRTLK